MEEYKAILDVEGDIRASMYVSMVRENLETWKLNSVIKKFGITFRKETAVVQSLFIKVPVLIVRNHKDNEKPNLDIHANRSHANYIFTLLIDGTRNLDF